MNHFNIGGLVYMIDDITLSKIPYLNKIISVKTFKPSLDESGNYYIERTPVYFIYVLDYVRYNSLPDVMTVN